MEKFISYVSNEEIKIQNRKLEFFEILHGGAEKFPEGNVITVVKKFLKKS